jgi:hypothetical protein
MVHDVCALARQQESTPLSTPEPTTAMIVWGERACRDWPSLLRPPLDSITLQPSPKKAIFAGNGDDMKSKGSPKLKDNRTEVERTKNQSSRLVSNHVGHTRRPRADSIANLIRP